MKATRKKKARNATKCPANPTNAKRVISSMEKLTAQSSPGELLRGLMESLRLTPAKIAKAIPPHPVFSGSDFAEQIRCVLRDDEEGLNLTLGLTLDRYFGFRPGYFWQVQAEHDVRDEQDKERDWLARVEPFKRKKRTPLDVQPVDIMSLRASAQTSLPRDPDENGKAHAHLPLPPPKGYATWLDYAVQTLGMSTRGLYLDHLWGNQTQWPEDVERSDFEAAAEAELAEVRGLRAAVTPVASEAWDLYKGGRRLVNKMKQAEGGAITREQAAKRLNVSLAALYERIIARKVVVWTDETGLCHFPKWQFKGKGVLRGIVACLKILDTNDYWAVMRFFLAPSEMMGDICPLQLLRDGRIKDAMEVAAAASRHTGGLS